MSDTMQRQTGQTAAGPVDDALTGPLALLGPLGVLGALRSGAELFVEYGDPNDVLSLTQVEQLDKLIEFFDLA
ncbi:hypothetical protein ACFOOM_01005 [Streptomyces echinoruber]|uniref:Uncharacterized protein n=1 Tax=Streptomyces echinoruber TaxID=68898 RepID=A0A918QUF9_9ACTN|nr:hypothetical protein [Streptomyces echinoruber]GGZ73168.1 hypothetical protein GCM10010389_08330 [Streptomyces echinoruber]